MRIAIDISNCYHKSYAIVSNYSGFDITEEKWQLVLGRKFITDLLSILKKFEDRTEVILCFDASNYFRKQISPDYKGTRSKKQQEFYDVINEMFDLLVSKNLNCIKIDGLEADDILALCAESAKNIFTVLVSNDEDIRQLVDGNTVVFTANSNNLKVFCDSINTVGKNIPTMVGLSKVINPDIIFYEKLLLGCSGDNVKRLLPKGHGPAKVRKIFDFMGQGPDNDLLTSLKHFGYIDISYDDIQNQMQMVALGSLYMPTELSQEFYKFEINKIPVFTDMKMLLNGTRFIQ